MNREAFLMSGVFCLSGEIQCGLESVRVSWATFWVGGKTSKYGLRYSGATVDTRVNREAFWVCGVLCLTRETQCGWEGVLVSLATLWVSVEAFP